MESRREDRPQPDRVGNFVVALNETVKVMHAALELRPGHFDRLGQPRRGQARSIDGEAKSHAGLRSEEHTSELQSHVNLVCRLLLEKKKNKHRPPPKYEKKKNNVLYH